MTDTNDPVDATVEELSQLYEEHQRSAGPIQRIANRSTRMLSQPVTLAVVFAVIVLWMVGNSSAHLVGLRAVDPFPYVKLESLATLAALFTTLLILTTQRHEEKADLRRDRLTLQIAVLSEKKIAKVIALLEEQRRDNPLLASRVDAEAETMASPADSAENLEKLEASHRERKPDAD